jgi:ectoine hydroxylase-related dioxygenase (phytanoyl-CoA dioxygenase family)
MSQAGASSEMLDHYEPFADSTSLLNEGHALRQQLKRDGYLFLRGVGPKDKILQLRRDMLELCAEAGWVEKKDLMAGTWSGIGPFTEGEPEYMAVYKKVIHLSSFAAVPNDSGILELMSKVLDGPAMLHNRKIGRITFPKNVVQTTAAHQDWHYIRGTTETYTVWIPVGDCPLPLGGLAILAGSHTSGYIQHGNFSVKKYASGGLGPEQWPSGQSIEWRAGDFALGDLVVFHSHTIHKAMPNLTNDSLRLSIDNRYQLSTEAIEASSMGTHYNL